MESVRNARTPLDNEPSYTAACVILCASSLLSMLGSGLIMYMILRKKLLSTLYQRIMFQLSFVDLLSSIGCFLQPFLLPVSTQLHFAAGNAVSCDLLGLSFVLSVVSHMYAFVLSFYFYASTSLQWCDVKVGRFLEPWHQIVIGGVILALSVFLLSARTVKPNLLVGLCMPMYSVNEDTRCPSGLSSDDCESQTGANPLAGLLRITFSFFSVASSIGSIIFTWLLYCRFRAVAKRTQRSSLTDVSLRLQRAVMVQACCYTAAALNSFFVTILGAGATAYFTAVDPYQGSTLQFRICYGIVVILYVLFPLQGFFNCLVYIRPSMTQWKQTHPRKSWRWALRKVVLCDLQPPSADSANGTCSSSPTSPNSPAPTQIENSPPA